MKNVFIQVKAYGFIESMNSGWARLGCADQQQRSIGLMIQAASHLLRPRWIQFALVAALVLSAFMAIPVHADDADASPPRYYGDVESILATRCVNCHQPGQIGPMSLQTYSEVRPWAKAVRKAVSSREMPPFYAGGPIGRYVDDPRLTDEEIARITDWVDRGCPPGPVSEKQESLCAETATPKPSSKPDLLLETAPYEHRVGQEEYTLHFLDYEFEKETWISAIEFYHSDLKAVHHSTLYIFEPTDRTIQELEEDGIDYISGVGRVYQNVGEGITGWLPGQTPRRFPSGGVKMLRPGTRLALQNHYAPTEENLSLQSSLGIYYFDGVIDEVTGLQMTEPPQIRIPPGDPDYKLSWEGTFDEDVLVDDFVIHAHLRGKSSSVTFIYPDGTSEEVFSVPKYSFHWQRVYRLVEPIRAPKGTRAIHTMTWDNSSANPDNPDPTQWVTSGFSSSDEMWVSAVGYRVENAKPPIIYIHRGERVAVEGPAADRFALLKVHLPSVE